MVRECPFCQCPVVFDDRDALGARECPGCSAVSMPIAASTRLPLPLAGAISAD